MYSSMKLKEYLLEIEKFEQDYLKSSGMDQYVLGLSGGVDSSLVALLTQKAVGNDKLTCILMPIDSNPDDLNDGLAIAKKHNLHYLVIDGSKAYHQLLNDFKDRNEELDTATKSNLKVRIRMCILYAYAQMHRALVLGTDNADERYTGYFTKYGDGGVDLLPIVHLLKREVVEASIIYGLDEKYARRVPSAGLFDGQTDEREMGITYNQLDDFLLGKSIDVDAKKRIEHLHRISEHKRSPIQEPKPFERD